MKDSSSTAKQTKRVIVPAGYQALQMHRFFEKYSIEDVANHAKSTENPDDLRYLSYSQDPTVLAEIVANLKTTYPTLHRIAWTIMNIPYLNNRKLLRQIAEHANYPEAAAAEINTWLKKRSK